MAHEIDDSMDEETIPCPIVLLRGSMVTEEIDGLYRVATKENAVTDILTVRLACGAGDATTFSGSRLYYEARVETGGAVVLGLAGPGFDKGVERHPEHPGVGDVMPSWAFDGSRRRKRTRQLSDLYGQRWKAGDMVGVLLDIDTKEISFSLNGKDLGPAFTLNDEEVKGLYPAASFHFGQAVVFNFGRAPFEYNPRERGSEEPAVIEAPPKPKPRRRASAAKPAANSSSPKNAAAAAPAPVKAPAAAGKGKRPKEETPDDEEACDDPNNSESEEDELVYAAKKGSGKPNGHPRMNGGSGGGGGGGNMDVEAQALAEYEKQTKEIDGLIKHETLLEGMQEIHTRHRRERKALLVTQRKEVQKFFQRSGGSAAQVAAVASAAAAADEAVDAASPATKRSRTGDRPEEESAAVGEAEAKAFGYEYFEKLSTFTGKDPIAEQPPAEPTGAVSDGPPGEESELGVIKLGVHEVQASQADEELGESVSGGHLSQDVLMDRVAMLFQEADTDGNGTLSRAEFQQVFEMFGADIGLTTNHVLKIMAEADNNDDGVIEYKEFLPAAIEMIQAIMATEQYSENKVIRKKRASAKMDVHDYLMKGLPRHELEGSIQEIFRGADGDGSGALDRGEFIRCLKESGLGFTRRELNLILTLIDKNGDGLIDYQEFLPVCFSMMVEILSDKVQEVPEEEVALSERVYDILLAANGGEERMVASDASDCLYRAGLGLRYVQVPAIMSAVTVGEDGIVAANEVADAVAGVMCALNHLQSRQHHSEGDASVNRFRATRQAEGLAKVAGLDSEEFKIKLGVALRATGDEGETFATKDSIRDVIKEAFPELEARQLHALENLAVQQEDGRWGFANIEKWGFRTLQEIQDQHILLESIKPARSEQAIDSAVVE
eukprot:g4753.t1